MVDPDLEWQHAVTHGLRLLSRHGEQLLVWIWTYKRDKNLEHNPGNHPHVQNG